MPSYDYRCSQCGLVFEVRHPIKVILSTCPDCGAKPEKLILSPPAAHGSMARGRELAMRSLQAHTKGKGHGQGCPCCH
jgi:putative FmdB family regulatory protein